MKIGLEAEMTESLKTKKCVPCEGGVEPLRQEMIDEYLRQTPDWHAVEIAWKGKPVKTLQRSFKFGNFRAAMAFLRQVEEIVESEGHHPDFCVHYNVVDFTIWTHAIGGLHENDFIVAIKIDSLTE
jgi:4a-hydroxytetrahydrobiopterin dehydratase